MLRADHSLRLSESTQARYAACGDSSIAKERVTCSVQRRVVREAGFRGNEAEGIDLLRSAVALYPNDNEILNAAFYLKFNIHVPCPLKVGKLVPEVPITELLNGVGPVPCSLSSIFGQAPLTVLCAGSYT